MSDPNDIQEDPEDQEDQEPVFDRFVELPAAGPLRGGQEESDPREPRSGFGQDDFSIGA